VHEACDEKWKREIISAAQALYAELERDEKSEK